MKRVQDHYFHQARREGFAARSAFKLEQIDRRRKILRRRMRVLDLGCAPGSWLQYAAGRVAPAGRLVGVDLQPIGIDLPETVRLIEGDVFLLAPADLMGDGGPFDVILSDLAPKTTGVPSADAARSADLVRRALELSRTVLVPGGALLAKVFQGGEFPSLRQEFQSAFDKVTVEKPQASRAESVELFLLGMGKHP